MIEEEVNEYKPYNSGTAIGIANLVILLMCVLQVASSGKNASGFEAVLYFVAISFMLTIVGAVYTLKGLHKDRKGSTLGLIIHGVLVLFYFLILGLFLGN